MRTLLTAVENGLPDNGCPTEDATPYWRYRDALYIQEGVIMYEDRVVVPPSLHQVVLENLHAAHQGVSTMELRARTIVFWPGMTADIHRVRASCGDCNRGAPSQAPTLSTPAEPPSTPFESIFADFCEFGGRHYLIVGDRLSGWVEIFTAKSGTSQSGAAGLIAQLRAMFATFGVPNKISSDCGPEFRATSTSDFLTRWGVFHRESAAYNPQSNGRAEAAVKTAKRLLRSNIGPDGILNNDRLLRGLLQLRNTPDPDCKLSPAQIIFGRPLRDAFSFINRLEKYSNPAIRPLWREAWADKEAALRTRFVRTSEILNEHAHTLPPLQLGDKCFIQNQTGNAPKKWDRTGTVTEVLDHDRYGVKLDGSGRVTIRNRRFLRSYIPASTGIESHQKTMPAPYLTESPIEGYAPGVAKGSEHCVPSETTESVHETFEAASDKLPVIVDDTVGSSPMRRCDISPCGRSQLEKPTEQVPRSAVTKMPHALRALLPHNQSPERPSSNSQLPPRRNRHTTSRDNEANASDSVQMPSSDMTLATPPELPDTQAIGTPQHGRPRRTLKKALQYNPHSGTWE